MRYLLVVVIGVTLLMVSCATPPEVAQGTVIRCDEANKALTIHDQDNPGKTLEFLFGDAEIGANPHPGDIVRVAYRKQSGPLKAMRIMNLTRQKELKAGK